MEAVNGGLIKLGDDRAKLETLNSILWHGRSREHVPLLNFFHSPIFHIHFMPRKSSISNAALPNLTRIKVEKNSPFYFFEDDRERHFMKINCQSYLSILLSHA